MHEIKSIRVFQAAKVMATIYAIIAAVVGVLLAIVAFAKGHPRRAILALFGIPIGYALAGFVFIAFVCWLYNEVARRMGGIAFEIAPKEDG